MSDPITALTDRGEKGLEIYMRLHNAKQAKDQSAYAIAWTDMLKLFADTGYNWDSGEYAIRAEQFDAQYNEALILNERM